MIFDRDEETRSYAEVDLRGFLSPNPFQYQSKLFNLVNPVLYFLTYRLLPDRMGPRQ
jgi:hypothetical protein